MFLYHTNVTMKQSWKRNPDYKSLYLEVCLYNTWKIIDLKKINECKILIASSINQFMAQNKILNKVHLPGLQSFGETLQSYREL